MQQNQQNFRKTEVFFMIFELQIYLFATKKQNKNC